MSNQMITQRSTTKANRTQRMEIQNHGFEVVGESHDALDHIDRGREIDRHCDVHSEELHATLHRMEEATRNRENGLLMGLVCRAMNLMHEVQILDLLEEEHWQAGAPEHVELAADAGRLIIGLTDMADLVPAA